jgi:hypothetical protein
MPARTAHVCPKCTKPVPQRNYRSAAGLRYHRDCLTDAEQIALSRPLPPPRNPRLPPRARGRGRPPTERGAGARQVAGRLSAAESTRIDQDSARTGLSAFELLRRAYFGA